MGLSLAMLVMVAVEHFFLTPPIIEIGRVIDDLPPTSPAYKHFWLLHGLYSGFDILKMLLGAVFAFRLVVRRAPDKDHFVKEYDKLHAAAQGTSPRG